MCVACANGEKAGGHARLGGVAWRCESSGDVGFDPTVLSVDPARDISTFIGLVWPRRGRGDMALSRSTFYLLVHLASPFNE